jgi:glycosyltransferase involved in cell wall biosynthesis
MKQSLKKNSFFLIITDYGSFNNFLAEVAVELSRLFTVHVVCSKLKIINTVDKYVYSDYDIIFHNVDIPRTISISKLLRSSLKIYTFISIIKPSLVHSHFTTGIFPTVFFKVKGVRYIGTFHGLGMNSTYGFKKILFYFIENFCFKKLFKIILLNDKDLKLVLSKGFDGLQITPYGLGCDLSKLNISSFSEDDRNNLKVKLGIENKFVITFIGRFVEFKGFDIVVRVFNSLIRKFPNDIALLLIGGPDPIHRSGVDEEEYTGKHGIINIGFTSEIEKYLSVTNLFFFPSKKEGLPICVLESLSMGVPVLSFDERGICDLITNFQNGILVSSIKKDIDIVAFGEIVSDLIQNQKIVKSMSDKALANRTFYSRSTFVEKQVEFYSTIVPPKR